MAWPFRTRVLMAGNRSGAEDRYEAQRVEVEPRIIRIKGYEDLTCTVLRAVDDYMVQVWLKGGYERWVPTEWEINDSPWLDTSA